MKLRPPEPIIDEKNPFKEALFGRKEFAESLTNLLRNVSEGLVIFVNAPWGTGKTTFAKMWLAELQNQKLKAIYFDAYAADYHDDPFVSFSGEILEFIDKHIQEAESIAEPRRKFKKTAVAVAKRLGGLAVKVGVRAATMGAVDAADLDLLTEIGSEVATDVSDTASDIFEKRIENYSKDKDSLKAFKQSLAELAGVVRKKQNFPLTIIVDELDRCRPDFALGLLERIKHLFDVEDVVFVLLVNREQIESYIHNVYGEKVDAQAYLLKFGNLFLELPNKNPAIGFQQQKGRHDYCRILFEHHGFLSGARDAAFLTRISCTLADHFDLTLREIEKVFTTMALYFGSLPNNQLTNEFLISMLSILKFKRPLLYQKLSVGTASAEEFFQHTRLDKIKKIGNQEFNQEWIKFLMDYCLMSETEFAKVTAHSDTPTEAQRQFQRFQMWLGHYNLEEREKLIPFLCGRLDLISISPQ